MLGESGLGNAAQAEGLASMDTAQVWSLAWQNKHNRRLLLTSAGDQ